MLFYLFVFFFQAFKTELVRITQQDVNSCYVEKLRMNELTSIVSAYRHRKSNAYPVLTQQVQSTPAPRDLSAENVEPSTNDLSAENVEPSTNDLSAENVVIAQQISLSAESVEPNYHDFQPGGPESQVNEDEYHQSDSAENQNMPEGGTEAQYSSQMDRGNDQHIPEGGSDLESQSADDTIAVSSRETEIPDEMESEYIPNGGNELESQSADDTTAISSRETEIPDEMDIDESVENVDNSSQVPQAQGDYQAQVENHVTGDPSREVGSAPAGDVGTETYRNTNGNNIENDSATDVGSIWDVEDAVSDFDMGVPQDLIRSMDISSPISYTERFFLEDLTENLDASIEDPELEASTEGSELDASTEADAELERPGTMGRTHSIPIILDT